jgi:hypothetical protein
MFYFAYGSNMCTGRLRRRVPSATAFRVANLSKHVFRFHKRSTDGSGKSNALSTDNAEDFVRGVLFEIDLQQKPELDDAEGVGQGYVEVPVTVTDEAGEEYQAFMYIAEENSIDDALRPYSWYQRFVVEGARQHNLPADYIAQIETMPATDDPNTTRDARNRAIPCG